MIYFIIYVALSIVFAFLIGKCMSINHFEDDENRKKKE